MISRRRFFAASATASLAMASLDLEVSSGQDDAKLQLRAEALDAMRRATEYFRKQVASHGGYVYHYTPDLARRWGEGEATRDQIWVQPPGTPTVGLAYVKAYEATQDTYYLDAVNEVATALIYGQLESGGWTNCIDFDPKGNRTARYRNGKGRGKNNSSLDDGQTQTAIRFLMAADKANRFQQPAIKQSVAIALKALLAAQFRNGGFPQVWSGPVADFAPVKASYPDSDYRTVERIKNYWDMPTLNDNVCVHVAQVFMEAHRIYGHPETMDALQRLGDFLLLAQMPEPQPAWAQQYSQTMQPIWARRFEPPAISGHESQGVIELLMDIAQATGKQKYLEPIPEAIRYLHASTLDDGQIARYYELRTNRPLYMQRDGDIYTPTYDDSNLPAHYSWKSKSKIARLEERLGRIELTDSAPKRVAVSADKVRSIIKELDAQARWITSATGERLVGQVKFEPGAQFVSSAAFSENLSSLSDFVAG